MRHKKVSGLANTAANKVGGADWDDGHANEVGDLFQVGHIRFEATAAAHINNLQRFGNINNDFVVTGNTLNFTHGTNYPMVPLAEGGNFFGHLSAVGQTAPLPAAFGPILTVDPFNGNVSLEFPGGKPASGTVSIFISIFAVVT